MKKLSLWLTGGMVMLLAAPAARAFTPQTITVDGVNDFDSGNLLDADGGDTETKDWCTGTSGNESPLDLGDIYVTNDANFLYFGFQYDHACFCDIDLGIAIDVNTAAGGATDAFGRKIAWDNLVDKPDFYLYDVAPTSCNTYNYEVLYKWTGSWTVQTDGPNGLGIVDNTGFEEGKLSLATLGVAAGDTVHVEFFVTQEGSTKGPLDAACSDGIQLSTPGGTTFDVASPVEMTCMLTYVVQGAADSTPPTLNAARAVGFTVNAQKQISLATSSVDVQFSEPVGTGAATAGNYSISNTAATVTAASVDGSDPSVVHLTLSSTVMNSGSFYNVTAVNVQDLAGNPIVNNGTGNVAGFFLKDVHFEGNMSVFLLTHSSPPDSFFVEGSLSPLTFTPKDNALLTDADHDSVYVTDVPISVSRDKGTGKAEASLDWKFYHNGQGYEPRSNRQFAYSSDNGGVDTVFAYWNDDLPSTVTGHPVDVLFQVDATRFNPGPGDTVGVTGDQSPLPNFATPGILLNDAGTNGDQTAGDKIYAGYVRFPTGSYKYVNYKYTFNGSYECLGQGDRNVYLNDAAYDTVGGTDGALVLPPRGIDRCTVTDKAVKVVFRVDAGYWFGGPITSVGVNGDRLPLTFDVPSLNPMADNGVSPDAAAGDDTFTVAVIFPDSTNLIVNYKYLINDGYECMGYPDRVLTLDDVAYSTSVPQVPPVGIWDYCSDITTGLPDLPGRGGRTLNLAQNYPNPFGSSTVIEFRLDTPGRADLTVFDVAGRKVKSLVSGRTGEGLHVVQWDGRDDAGRSVRPGVYFYTLEVNSTTTTRRMILLP